MVVFTYLELAVAPATWYNIIQKNDEILIEGINFISLLYPAYDSEIFIDTETQNKYSIEMIMKSIDKIVPNDDFLKMLIFDYLIGNSDRHQSNWAIILNLSNGSMKWSPLYDNSSSLCAYILEEHIKSYLGKDKVRWNSLVDTKSKSLIRCKEIDTNRPTHLEVLNYIKHNYYEKTYRFVEKVGMLMTETNISDIVGKYLSSELSENKKLLIQKYLLWKVKKMKETYFGKEELDVD